MKNGLTIVLAVSMAVLSSFSSASYNGCLLATQDIQFKVFNDTQADFSYSVGGVQKTIPKGQSVGFSYPENTVIHTWINGKEGSAWFTVKAEMLGKSYQLSALLKNQ